MENLKLCEPEKIDEITKYFRHVNIIEKTDYCVEYINLKGELEDYPYFEEDEYCIERYIIKKKYRSKKNRKIFLKKDVQGYKVSKYNELNMQWEKVGFYKVEKGETVISEDKEEEKIEYIDIQVAAKKLKIDRSTLTRWCREGKVNTITVKSFNKITKEELKRLKKEIKNKNNKKLKQKSLI